MKISPIALVIISILIDVRRKFGLIEVYSKFNKQSTSIQMKTEKLCTQ